MLNHPRRASYADALNEARGLISEDAENPEYDRALFELIARIYAVPEVCTEDRAEQVKGDLLDLACSEGER